MRLLVVAAPPGWGKTTVLAQWARQASVDVAWWRADPEPADPVADLLTGLAAALRPRCPRLARTPSLDELVAALDGIGDPVVIVIDDFESIADDRVGAVLERLLLATPDRVHVMIGSRVQPVLNLARSELPSLVVGARELRFRADEVAELFRAHGSAALDFDESHAVADETDGWAAALHLTLLASDTRGSRTRTPVLSDVIRHAGGYVDRTFIRGLDADELALLRATAPFETLLGEYGDEFAGLSGSEEVLARLVRRGVVIANPSGPGGSLPKVVRGHLLAGIAADEGRQGLERRFRAVGAFLSGRVDGSSGSVARTEAAAAARAWAAGGAWTEALALLTAHWRDVVDGELGWLREAPHDLAAHPLVRTALAEEAARRGNLRVARDLLEQGPSPDHPEAGATAARLDRFCRMWTEGDLQPDRRWFELLRSAVRRPNPDRAAALGGQERSVLALLEHVIAGDLTAARDGVARWRSQVTDPVLGCVFDLVDLALHPAARLDASDIAENGHDLGLPWVARLATGVSHRSTPDLIAADVASADARGDVWGALLLTLVRGYAELTARVPAGLVFEDAARRCRELDAPALEAWARSGLALADVGALLPDAAREAESAVGFAHSAQVPGALALARLALARSRPDPAMEDGAREELAELGVPFPDTERPLTGAGLATVVGDRTPPVSVKCFGGFRFEVGGSPADLNGVRPRARTLLRLLALHAGSPVHREVIADGMWPHLDAAAALHNLHVCISGLRTALEPGAARGANRLLVRDGDRYLLALPDGSECDVRSFEDDLVAADLACAGHSVDAAVLHLGSALDRYVGDLLPEDGPAEWVLPRREHLRGRAAEAALQLGRLHLECRRPDEAATAARRSIEIDGWRDAAWRLLIKACDSAGDSAEAQRARQGYLAVLTSLGVVDDAVSSVGPGGTARRR
ncbi:BTAD domain-containing putative transcriptional regulator [Nocardioides albidus]|uniref:BTAD domain-containing putative transcriptional regulator n=1 Tax=Nocardioides albidus TaxID=1517589 RepID=UPI001305183E|nr:BTAD domain-containing putative transcriptional regulator [Nocardioides albidus]